MATSVLRLRQLWALLIHFGGVHESTWVIHLLVGMQPFKWAGAWVGRVKSGAIYSTTEVSPTVGLHFWFRRTSLQFRVFVRCVSLWTSLSFLFELLYFLISFTVFLLSLWIWPPVHSSFTVFPYGFRFFLFDFAIFPIRSHCVSFSFWIGLHLQFRCSSSFVSLHFLADFV